MNGLRPTARRFLYCTATAAMLGTAVWAVSATAGTPPPAQLAVVGGTGIAGGTVAVSIQLAQDTANAGVSADLDIAFPTDLVEFFTPVTTNCQVAQRLQSTHQVGGTVPQPGLLRFSVFDPTGLDPLGDGEIATCDFHILAGAPTGTAALTVQFVELRGADGDIPVDGIDGAITITTQGPATFTPTSTPSIGFTSTATATLTAGTASATVTATATPTTPGGTQIATATATPTTPGTTIATATVTPTGGTKVATATVTPTGSAGIGTPTATKSAIPTSTRKDNDGCNIVPAAESGSAGTLALLLAPALLVWARRRRF